MNILLIGGTGTLSTAVRNFAIIEGHQVSLFNRGNHNTNIPREVKIIIGDFKNKASLEANFIDSKYDVVIDFLSRKSNDIERVYPIFKNRCQQYIFISSACVYRREKKDFPIKESSPKPNTDWSYNIEKYECEETLIKLSKNASSYYTIIRPYITYDENRIPFGIAPEYQYHRTIIERIRAGKPMFVWDDGKALTTVTHVEDFAKAIVGLFLNNKAKNEDFHITGDFHYTGRELIEKIYHSLDVKPNIISVPSEKIATMMPQYASMLKGDRSLDALFDNSKIKNAVPGLIFQIDIYEGMKRIIRNYDSKPERYYDYAYEGQVDKMLKNIGVETQFVNYQGSDRYQKVKYYIYKYAPYKYANRLCRILKVN